MNLLAGAALAGVLLAAACDDEGRAARARPAAPEPNTKPPSAALTAAPSATPASSDVNAPSSGSALGPLRFVLIGGGPTPESNEVSLEQDVELVRRALPAPGLVLFAGGSRSASVRELDPSLTGDAVKLALGELFAPRNGRQSRYHVPRFSAERATFDNVEARLSAALAQAGPPLFVHIAGHGEPGQSAKENSVALWGGGSLSVKHLAELHEQHQRPLRLVATSCFSGGFAELAFAHAEEKPGRPAAVLRCGVFAGTSDRETSGCDPNPNRRAQESYGLYLIHALSGTRRDGTPLPLELADYDHDGKIGLLDAHTWARIEAVSFDVPTTTSERWLRRMAPSGAAIDPALLPEEAAVAQRLGASLGLTTEQEVERRWQELTHKLDELDTTLDDAERALTAREADLSTLLLEQWPVLDDPFHPDFEQSFADNRAAIESALTRSNEARARVQAHERVAALYDQLYEVQIAEARVLRLRRAYETRHLASALLKRGGPAALYYKTLLACERGQP